MSPFRTYIKTIQTRLLIASLLIIASRASAQNIPALRASIAQAENDSLKAFFLNETGKAYLFKPGELKNDLDSAGYFFDQARILAQRTGHYNQYLTSLFNMTSLWIEMGTPWRAREVVSILSDDQQASVYARLSYHYTFKPGEYAYDLDTALMYGKKAIAISRKTGNIPVLGNTAQTMSTAYIEANQLTNALTMLSDVPAQAHYIIYHRVGYQYLMRRDKSPGDVDSSETHIRNSIRLGIQFNKRDLEHRNYYTLALIEFHRNRHVRAKIFMPHLQGVLKADICMTLARWHFIHTNEPDSARVYAKMAIANWDPERHQQLIKSARNFLSAVDIMEASRRVVVETVPGAQRFRKFIDMGRQYQSGFPAFDVTQLSISVNYIQSAIKIADSLNIDTMRILAWKEMAKTQCLLGDVPEARKYILLALSKYNHPQDTRNRALIWMHFGNIIRRQRPQYCDVAEAYLNASLLFAKAGDMENELNTGMESASFLQEDGRPEEASKLLLGLANKYANTDRAPTYKINRHLALLAQMRGDLGAALRYAMTGLRQAEQQNDKLVTTIMFVRLGEIYRDLVQYENSIDAYRKAVANAHGTGPDYDYYAALALTELLIEHRSAAEALAFVKQVYKDDPPVSYYPERLMEAALAQCYNALGQTGEAEKYYLSSIRNIDHIRVGDKLYTRLQLNVGKFYLGQKKYTIASEHLRKALSYRPDIASISLTNNAHYMLFQCDSAMGMYRQAIDQYQLYKYYNDSLFNVAKSRQISELQIQYETEKKDQSLLLQEQEIRLREQDIMLLMRKELLQKSQLNQAILQREQSLMDARRKDQDIQLKQNDIALLTQRAEIQQSKLEQERLMRNVSFGGAVLLLAIIGLLINGYRLKQKNNQSLQEKQVEIGQKNASLEKLLHEKEWLLKEIHHRVKNNLQIVMSLLNSQSAFLQNDAALVAIRDSQHRVQAISLIHKKLYQSDNVGVINMPHYIHELVDYLLDCFDAGRNVRFRINVAPIQLDVSQAVPIGLILNEAITNSIKYAFPGNREGNIHITFDRSAAGHFTLTVADDGMGLPPDFEPGQSRSLGMSLMEGLSNDLGGHFNIRNTTDGGAEISVWFEDENFIRPELLDRPAGSVNQ